VLDADPTNPNEAPNLNLNGSLAISEGEILIVDINATDDKDSKGAGLTYSLLASPDRNLFNIDPATGEISYIIQSGIVVDGDSDGDAVYEISVQVADSEGLTSSQSLEISVVSEVLQSASTLELEYFSRQSAYGYSPKLSSKYDRVEADADSTPLEKFLDGWSITEEFVGGNNTFRAIVLDKSGYAPVVAVRGTQTTLRD
jgi:hypothetical protein